MNEINYRELYAVLGMMLVLIVFGLVASGIFWWVWRKEKNARASKPEE